MQSRVLLLCLLAGVVALAVADLNGRAQVREFVPVTDAMLQDPEPADWLNWRRTLDGWGYSPLSQINQQNVSQMRLVWSWALEMGTSQATPLVYDGVMYLANPGNVIQALDAATGDLIWEHRRDFGESNPGPRQLRSLAITARACTSIPPMRTSSRSTPARERFAGIRRLEM